MKTASVVLTTLFVSSEAFVPARPFVVSTHVGTICRMAEDVPETPAAAIADGPTKEGEDEEDVPLETVEMLGRGAAKVRMEQCC